MIFIQGYERKMRFNEKELAELASQPGDKEGRLSYKSPGFREAYKERWFKLKGNILFYFRLNEHGAVYEQEPVGALLIENCRIMEEKYMDLPFAFSITFAGEIDKKHYFGCRTQKHCNEWVKSLQECSYEFLRSKLQSLRENLIQLTGKDPLSGLPSNMLQPKVEKTDSDIFFSRINPAYSESEVPDNTSLI